MVSVSSFPKGQVQRTSPLEIEGFQSSWLLTPLDKWCLLSGPQFSHL